MFDISLTETFASLSGPALLTNASALLLGAASNRYMAAINDKAREEADGRLRQQASSEILAKRLTSGRVASIAAAVHALHVALISFGTDCALVLAMTLVAPSLPSANGALGAIGTALAFTGVAGLTIGVVLMATASLCGFSTQPPKPDELR